MVKKATDTLYVGKFITFEKLDYEPGKASNPYFWEVTNTKNGTRLGYIEWFKTWKKFSFFNYPEPCVFEEVCLRDVSDFIELLTKEKKELDKAKEK